MRFTWFYIFLSFYLISGFCPIEKSVGLDYGTRQEKPKAKIELLKKKPLQEKAIAKIDSLKKKKVALKEKAAAKIDSLKKKKVALKEKAAAKIDSLKKKKGALKEKTTVKIDSLKKKLSLLQKIKKVFQFKANFRKAEKNRINAIFDKLMLTKRKDTAKVFNTYNTYQSVPIDEIETRIDSLFEDFAASAKAKQSSDTEINKLVEKLLPMVTKKIELEKAEERKQKRIRLIRQLMPFPKGIVHTATLKDKSKKLTTIKLVPRGEVIGFHPYWMNKFYLNYNYKALNTLVYYGYEVNGRTGGCLSLHGWDTAQVITKAQKAGCKVLLSVFGNNITSPNALLKNKEAQVKLCNDVNDQLKQQNANGINIRFDNFGANNREKFTDFIRLFYNTLQHTNKAYEITLTVPVIDKNFNYDIEELSPYISRFIIDFSKINSFGPIAPLKAESYSLDSGIDRYLNSNVSPKKFIACITYNGVVWNYNSRESTYWTYNKIMNSYGKNNVPVYDINNGARLDILENGKDTIRQVWYDDAQTLSQKYDFILGKGIGGIGVWGLGSDDGRPELWNTLIDKTRYITSKSRIVPPCITNPKKPTWRKSIETELSLYSKLFKHPCEFTDSDQKKMKSDEFMLCFTPVLFIVLIIVALYSMNQRKIKGEEWEKSKLFYGILIFLVLFLVLSIMFSLFLEPDFSGFGQQADCETSFGTILKIMGSGFIIGLIAMRFLVFPMIKPKEVP